MEFVKAHKSNLTDVISLMHGAISFMNAQGNFQWDQHYPTPKVFEKDIEKGQLYAVIRNGVLIGVVCLNFDQPVEYIPLNWKTPPQSLVIHRMIVSEKYRGGGVAKFMFQKAEETALIAGLSSIRSDTNQANPAMNHLFRISSYRFTGNIILRDNPVLFNCYEKILSL